jgi:hypothetical protein
MQAAENMNMVIDGIDAVEMAMEIIHDAPGITQQFLTPIGQERRASRLG